MLYSPFFGLTYITLSSITFSYRTLPLVIAAISTYPNYPPGHVIAEPGDIDFYKSHPTPTGEGSDEATAPHWNNKY